MLNNIIRALAYLCLAWAAFALVCAFPWLLVVALCVAAWYAAKRRPWQGWAHGTAHFMTLRQARRFVKATRGVILGRLVTDRGLGPVLRLDVPHVAVLAPTGVGKGVSIICPYLLTCPDSMVVIDFKGELFKITAAHRRRMGHRVVVLDPFKVVTDKPDSFNPLDGIRDDRAMIDQCRDLAEALVIRTGQEKEPFWNNSASFIIFSTLCYICHFAPPGGERSLQMLRSIVGNAGRVQTMIERLKACTLFDGVLARIGHQLAHFRDDKMADSVYATANTFLQFLDSPALVECTSTSSFMPTLKHGLMTIYLIIPPDHMRAQSALLRMWVSSFLRAVVSQGLGGAPVTFVLDEAASLGHMECLDDLIDKYRGYNVKSLFAYQSMGQIQQCWVEGRSQSFLSNTSQIFFGVNDLATAEYVSKRLGERTITVASGGTNSGGSRSTPDIVTCHSGGSSGRSWGESSSWNQVGRPLLKPEEVAALNPRYAITFTPGCAPILTCLVRYYEGSAGMLGSITGRLQAFGVRIIALGKAVCFLGLSLLAATAATGVALERERKGVSYEGRDMGGPAAPAGKAFGPKPGAKPGGKLPAGKAR